MSNVPGQTNVSWLSAFLGLATIIDSLSKCLIELPNLRLNWPRLMKSSFARDTKEQSFQELKVKFSFAPILR
jgi:hypothetical protein